MVRKLFKHEFHVWFRMLWVVAAMVLMMSGANRIVQFFETDSAIYYTFFAFSLFAIFILMIVAMSVPSFYGVIRFYKNLFSGEGYLSFTLPVTPAQHLWVKSLTATVMTLAVGLICILGCLLLVCGDVFTELCKAAAYYANRATAEQIWNILGILAELLVLTAVSTFSGHFLLYSCVCLGQLFRKNRVLGAFGIYFIYYVLSQVLSGMVSFAVNILAIFGALDFIGEFIDKHPFLSIHGYMIALIVFSLVQAAVCFIICNVVMKRKLNLE